MTTRARPSFGFMRCASKRRCSSWLKAVFARFRAVLHPTNEREDSLARLPSYLTAFRRFHGQGMLGSDGPVVGWRPLSSQPQEARLPEWFHKKKEKPLHASPIEDYAMIGDLETAALVNREGSIDWLCWPSFSSGACFAALLGTAEQGYWRIRPEEEIVNVRRRYEPDTMIVETTFETKSGEVMLTDFMPPRGHNSDVIRIVQGVRGKVRMRMDLVVRFDYGLTIPWVTTKDDDLHAVAGPHRAVLHTECDKGEAVEMRGEDCTTVAEFKTREGSRNCFTLTYGGSFGGLPPH